MTAEAFEVTIWRPEDLGVVSEILTTASETHGIPYDGPDWFVWKFGDSPWGPAVVAYARSNTGRLAGMVAFGRYRLNLGGSVFDAGISYETFVHPDFQRQGLFQRLLAVAEQEARARGAAILINFPNAASKPGFLRSAWQEIGGVQTWLQPRRPFRVVSRLRGLLRREPLVPSAVAANLVSLAADLSDLGPPLAGNRVEPPNRRVHDVQYLRWRFTGYPQFDYRVVEEGDTSALVRLGHRAGLRETQILDVFSTDAPAGSLRPLIRSVSTATDADMVSILTTPGNPITSLLPRMGFLSVPNRANFFAKCLDPELAAGPPSRWAISGVDIHTW